MSQPAPRAAGRAAWALALLLALLLIASVRVGSTGLHAWATTLQGWGALLALAEPLPGNLQVIVETRVWRVLTTAGVGAALALSGALLQGLFRNGLAAPSIVGVTGGASLGASLAILALAGIGPEVVRDAGPATLLVPLFGFVGALGAVGLVAALASRGGQVSVPALLLTGIAVNTCLAGVLALVVSLALGHWEVAQQIVAWTLGTLENRSWWHAATVWLGLGVAVTALPFVAWELDLVAYGEEDARSLGVNTRRIKVLTLGAASLAAASAVAVAGQVAFVGLVVPHLVRLLAGRRHRVLLPLSLLGGAVFLLGVDSLQRLVLGGEALRPGVVMSLVGGPFFLALLVLRGREFRTW